MTDNENGDLTDMNNLTENLDTVVDAAMEAGVKRMTCIAALSLVTTRLLIDNDAEVSPGNGLDDGLKPCPLCGGDVYFDKNLKHINSACNIVCPRCGQFNLSDGADPLFECKTTKALRARIVPMWNNRPDGAINE